MVLTFCDFIRTEEPLPHVQRRRSRGGRECREVGGVRRLAIQGAMGASLVVEAQIRGQVGFRISNAVIGLEIPLLVLDGFPQVLDKDVVPPGPLPAMLIRMSCALSRPVNSSLVNRPP